MSTVMADMDGPLDISKAREACRRYGRLTDAEGGEWAFDAAYKLAAHAAARHLGAALRALAEAEATAVREARTALMADERLHAHSTHDRTAVAGTGLTAWCLGCRVFEAMERYAAGVEGGDRG